MHMEEQELIVDDAAAAAVERPTTPTLVPTPRQRKSKSATPPPVTLNPFGDDEPDDDDGDTKEHQPPTVIVYPDDLNPFGSDDDDDNGEDQTSQNNSSLNPFGSEEEDGEEEKEENVSLTPNRKKGRAPAPPSPSQPRSPAPPSPSQPRTPAPSSPSQSRTPTPAPRRSKTNQQSKGKKRPAPPRPALKRSLKMPAEDMDKELEQLEQQELPATEERLGKLQRWLDGSDGSEPDYETQVERFLEAAKHRCQLARRQKELVHMKREMKLEENQLEVEYQLRIIMSKQEAQKTAADAKEEQRLLQQMMELIEERNDIVEKMIQDENRVIEEYQTVVAKVLQPPVTWKDQTACGAGKDRRHLSLSRWNKRINKTLKKLKAARTDAKSSPNAATGGGGKSGGGKSLSGALKRLTMKPAAARFQQQQQQHETVDS